MTAINTKSPLKQIEVFSPSSSVQEAKSRFASALSNGIDKLVRLGHGRERAAKQVLSEIARGCSADDEEVFNLMASHGVSMDDATKASIVSSAFRKAVSSDNNNIRAIDELTSRLSLSNLSHREPLRHVEGHEFNNTVESPPASLSTRPSAQNLLGGTGRSRSPKSAGDKPKGKKRVLADKTKSNTDVEEAKAAAKAEDEVNAKISKEEKTKDTGRKGVVPTDRRGKRPASLRGVDGESQPVKRVRSTSTI